MKNFLHHLQQYFLGLTRAGSHQTWMTFFVVSTGFVLFYLIYLSTRTVPDLKSVTHEFQQLSNFESVDIRQFLRKKDELRRDVARTLRGNPSRQAQVIAASISLYLFPDLLPNKDFQKQDATELWIPLQKEIEARPGSFESRIKFEEMKATIWNFENPDRKSPRISETARRVIEIYDKLSASGRGN